MDDYTRDKLYCWRPEYIGRRGELLTLEEWAAKLADIDYKRVASDEVGPLWVSTVWLGLDHGFGRAGPPIIFETMAFPRVEGRKREGSEWAELLGPWRYATEEEALRGHRAIVAKLTEVSAQPAITAGDVRALLEDFDPE